MISMTSYLSVYQILLLLWMSKTNLAVFGDRRPRPSRFLIHLEDSEERHNHPKPLQHPTVIRVHHTSPIIEDKFYYDLSKINKKHPRYQKYGKLKSTWDFEKFENLKSCCPGTGHLDFEKFDWGATGEWFRPVSVSLPASVENYGIADEGKSEDVKPVTEIIEDDLKYDFRTKTHSYR